MSLEVICVPSSDVFASGSGLLKRVCFMAFDELQDFAESYLLRWKAIKSLASNTFHPGSRLVGLSGTMSPGVAKRMFSRGSPLEAWTIASRCAPTIHVPDLPPGYSIPEDMFFAAERLNTVTEADNRLAQLLALFLKSRPTQTAVIFCLTRRHVVKVVEFLRSQQLLLRVPQSAIVGATASTPEIVTAFVSQGSPLSVRVLVSTSASAMGINSLSIFFVVTYGGVQGTGLLTQEALRARRDRSSFSKGVHLLLVVKQRVLEAGLGARGSPERAAHANASCLFFVDNNSAELTDVFGMDAVDKYASSSICRRAYLCSLIEGQKVPGCGESCDVCAEDGTLEIVIQQSTAG